MIIYVMADRESGEVLSLHHEVDAEGRSCRASDHELLDALPPGVERERVAILSTEVEDIPSSRAAVFEVDVRQGTVTVRQLQGERTTEQVG